MEFSALIRELGSSLGFELAFSEAGTCGVFFDRDEILFELNENRLFIIADLAPSEGREDAYARMLTASNLGVETGAPCIGIDGNRNQFTLCRVLEGDLSYEDFEKILVIFVGAVRYWKEWLALPPSDLQKDVHPLPFELNAIKA